MDSQVSCLARLVLVLPFSVTLPVYAEEAPLEPGLFLDITREAGLDFLHDPGTRGEYFVPESLGAGGAFFDYDGDGDLDVYLVNGARRDAAADSEPLRNRLFRQDADGAFRDVTAVSGLGDTGYGMGVAIGDFDGDRELDVYVTNVGPDALYRNRGNGTFENVTGRAGIDSPAWGSSAVFFDPDLDGDLDLYVANYLELDRDVVCSDLAGRPDYCGPASFEGVADRLFRNDGNGSWTDISASAGIDRVAGKGLGVVSADFDGDRRPDLYVANDGQPNLLWLNRSGPQIRFVERAAERGVAVNAVGRAEAGMGIAVGDADGDGSPDLFITHLRTETNTLYRHAGELGFVEATAAAGLAGPSLPFTGFGTAFLDVDNDGDLDLAVANGRVTRGPRAATATGPWQAYAEPDLLFRNDGRGRFRTAQAAGALTQRAENSRGLAVGDVDSDGRLDLLLTQAGGPARLLRNAGQQRGHWLGTRVWGDPPGVELTTELEIAGQLRPLVRHVAPAGSYLSSHDPRVHLGLAQAARVDKLRLRWPAGRTLILYDLPINQWLQLPPPATP
ncbi:MAG: CRTAC1 family protein [Acidobacteriota bacterium]